MTRDELIDKAEKLRRSISCGQTFTDLLELVKADADTLALLERAVITLAQYGQARCGVGFGKYPLGIRDAITAIQPLVDTQPVRDVVKAFDERLAQ